MLIDLKFTNKELDKRYHQALKFLHDSGYRRSAASWIDREKGTFYVCSFESVPGTHGHPKMEIQG